MARVLIQRPWKVVTHLRSIFSLNKILEVLVLSDVITVSAYGLLAPIFAVFLTEHINGSSLVVIGVSETIYLAAKSIFQIPFGILIDKTEGQKIDFWFLFLGSLITSLVLYFYLFASLPWHIYLISFIFGVGGALVYPAWTGLFTRNMVKDRESFAWSLSATTMEIGEAAAAVVGALIAERFGFNFLFIFVASLSLVGTFALFVFYKDLRDS